MRLSGHYLAGLASPQYLIIIDHMAYLDCTIKLLICHPLSMVFVAPLHHGTSGRVIFDLIIREGKRIVDLELDFREGRAQPVRAKEGLEHYLDLVNHASGDKDLIAELGIGLNPRITQMVGYTLTDEKIIGTVHLAIGNNKTMGGQNDSDLHWDMIVMKPTVVVDGVMLMEKGRFREEYN
ncbi:aminopeptidase [Candidatus Hakubella thermalkaliphila]|nr:aminopeptidase [Candidatus Hakubella thermalkaliphila]